ncbi:MAG: adenylyltransferase/cytidyltransferase family protein [Bacteroidota bacterium]
MEKKVVVSGCFDLLHSGHVAFLQEAASFGDLFVCIGSDRTVSQLKGRPPINSEQERRYMVEALRCVKSCRINTGSGLLDFMEELREIRPDVFVVNEDGHTPHKEELCRELGVDYKVLRRIPTEGLPVRSTTALRTVSTIPFRIDLAGGWLDQPFVSRYSPGPVVTISLEPTVEFNHRSGMASSSRNKAIELWKTALPESDPEQTARILFSCENPPGTLEVSGSQDALGICLPGLNRLHYDGSYWPAEITSTHQEDILSWLEDHLSLLAIGPRGNEYKVLSETRIDDGKAKSLAQHADKCWDAIHRKDLEAAGRHLTGSFEAQLAMFPKMADEKILQFIRESTATASGYKLSGAGGGGYIILLANKPPENAIRIRIRRRSWI